MNNLRLILFIAIFFLLKENVVAQQDYSFKRNFIDENLQLIDSTKGEQKIPLKSKADDSFQFLPSFGISTGFHDLGFKSSGADVSPVWNIFINFPFDKKEYFNWETAFYAFRFKESEVQTKTAFSVTYFGLKIYSARKNKSFRPFISAGLAGHTLYILPTLNVQAGVEYTINPSASMFAAVSTLSTNKDGSVYYIEERKYRMTAVFLGLRYQL